MKTAYITNYNASKIIESSYQDLEGDIYDHAKINFLNKREIQKLLKRNEFYKALATPEGTIKIIEILREKDTKTMVFEGQKPAYHINKDCMLLKKNMINIYIPQIIIENNRVEEFRAWYKNLRNKISDEQFQMRLNLKWGIQSLQEIEHDNSGFEKTINTTQKEIRTDIKNKINKMENFVRCTSKEVYETIIRYGTLSYLYKNKENFNKLSSVLYNEDLTNKLIKVSNKRMNNILREFEDNYKKPLIRSLDTFYKVKWNKKNSFKQTLLEAIGFKKCKSCFNVCQNEGLSILNNYYKNNDLNKKTISNSCY